MRTSWLFGAFGTVAILCGAWLAINHHRVVAAERDLAQAQFGACLTANRNNVAAIKLLTAAAELNAAQRDEARKVAEAAIKRNRELQEQLANVRFRQIDDAQEALDGEACADEPLPDRLRVLLHPGSDHRVSDGHG